MITIATYAPDGASDGLADRLRIRRQLRSLLNNTPLKLQAHIYVVYSDDPEQNGWYVPDFGSLVDLDGASGLATGVWKLEQVAWILAGHRRINREARNIWMRDLRTGLAWRDFLRNIYSTDFSALSTLSLTYLPHGANSIANAVSGQVVPAVPVIAGRDGGTCRQAVGLIDLATVSYERADSAWGLSDVIVYDRRGAGDAPAGGPGASWEEVYGSDYAWNWTSATPLADAPVLDNGLIRLRYDSTSTPGLRVDVWTGAAYVEQGKMCVYRIGDLSGFCDTWVAAHLVEWTPDRTVICVTLAAFADPWSREQVYITVQRGEMSAAFEVYPAPQSNGTPADAILLWTPALNTGAIDLNNSIVKIDSQGTPGWTPGAAGAAVYAATAGSGAGLGNSGQFSSSYANLGTGSFSNSENWAAILRCPTAYDTVGGYQTTLVVLQAANAFLQYAGAESAAYGVASDAYRVRSQNNAGYLQCQVAFAPVQPGQAIEAEAMTLGGGGTSTVVVDVTASGGSMVKSTLTTDANAAVFRAGWLNGFRATYRVFLRVKVSGGTGRFYAKTGATTGVTVSSTSVNYVWLDCGEIVANATTLEIHGWNLTGGQFVDIDRVEAIMVQDRVRNFQLYGGARDQAQAALMDSRALGALVAR